MDVSFDERMDGFRFVKGAGVAATAVYFYPRMIALHTLKLEVRARPFFAATRVPTDTCALAPCERSRWTGPRARCTRRWNTCACRWSAWTKPARTSWVRRVAGHALQDAVHGR